MSVKNIDIIKNYIKTFDWYIKDRKIKSLYRYSDLSCYNRLISNVIISAVNDENMLKRNSAYSSDDIRKYYKAMKRWMLDSDSSNTSGFNMNDEYIFIRYVIGEEYNLYNYIENDKEGEISINSLYIFNTDNTWFIVSFCKEEDNLVDVVNKELIVLLHHMFNINNTMIVFDHIVVAKYLYYNINGLSMDNIVENKQARDKDIIKFLNTKNLANDLKYKINQDILDKILDYIDEDYILKLANYDFIQFLLENDINLNVTENKYYSNNLFVRRKDSNESNNVSE